MPDRLARWINVLDFFPIVCKTVFYSFLAYVTFCCGQQVDWSCVDLEDPIFRYCWCTGEVTGLAENRVPERKQEVDGQFVYHKSRLPSIAVHFKSEALLSNLDDAVTATREAFDDERPDPSHGGVAVSIPTVTDDEEGHWDLGNTPWSRLPGVHSVF